MNNKPQKQLHQRHEYKQNIKSLLVGFFIVATGFTAMTYYRNEAREILRACDEMDSEMAKELVLDGALAWIIYKIAVFTGERVRSDDPHVKGIVR